jgi:pentatricopeptide repeat protein
MYGKCGVMEDAHTMFSEMTSRNLISWNSMISGAAQHGDGFSCLCLLSEMQEAGVEPNTITFVGTLTACSHAGLIAEALYCLRLLEQHYGFTTSIDHLNCIIDMLGRAGRLCEMWSLIVDMPFQPTGVSYTTLLNSCKLHSQVDLGVSAAECAFELLPEASALPLLMSNILCNV